MARPVPDCLKPYQWASKWLQERRSRRRSAGTRVGPMLAKAENLGLRETW